MTPALANGQTEYSGKGFYGQRCFRILSLRMCTGLLMLAALLLISPLFFSGKLNNMPIYVGHVKNGFAAPAVNLLQKLTTKGQYILQPNVCPENG